MLAGWGILTRPWELHGPPQLVMKLHDTQTLNVVYAFLSPSDIAQTAKTCKFVAKWANTNHPPPVNIIRGLGRSGFLYQALEFLPPADVASVAVADLAARGVVREVHNDRHRRAAVAARRIDECIRIIQEVEPQPATRLYKGYGDIAVPEGGPQVGSCAVVCHDDQDPWGSYRPAGLTGRVGTVVRCVKVDQLIIIYVMLEQSYAEEPCVVVQGTTHNFTSLEEVEDQGMYVSNSMWPLGLRPRHAKDACAMNEAIAEHQDWFGGIPQLTDEMWESMRGNDWPSSNKHGRTPPHAQS